MIYRMSMYLIFLLDPKYIPILYEQFAFENTKKKKQSFNKISYILFFLTFSYTFTVVCFGETKMKFVKIGIRD